MTAPPPRRRQGAGPRFWLILGALAIVSGAAAVLYPDLELDDLRERVGLTRHQAGTPVPAPVRAGAMRVAVEVTPAKAGPLVETIQAVGTLRPNEAVTVTSEIAGRVAKLAFREGQRVNAGDLLVQLDAAILRAELARSRSELTLARANHERNTRLARDGMASPRTRDESLAALQAAEAGIALAEARLEKTAIRAPLSGVVGLRAISSGAFVEPGTPIVELSDIDPIKLDFRVPELALPSLRNGQSVRVTVDALPGLRFAGEVYAIDPIVEPGGRAVRLRARIPNPDARLTAGLFARVEIVISEREQVLLIPESAVFARGNGRHVFRIVDGRAKLTPVSVGVRRPGQVEIREGLAAGDVVVTAGHQTLRDNGEVEVLGSAPVAAGN
jgi:membrane fusion protein (multidrug efflux system)